MEIQINWLAVVAATIIGTALAGLWYQEPIFGKAWRQFTGVTQKESKQAGNSLIVFMLLANFVTAVTLAVAIYITSRFFENSSILLALVTGFIVCLAFSVTALIVHNGFELKRKKLTLINSTYQFVLFLSMAFIISLFGV